MTEKEGFYTMFYFLSNWNKTANSDGISAILSLMEPLEDGEPAESDMLEYWKEACEIVENSGKPPIKKLS